MSLSVRKIAMIVLILCVSLYAGNKVNLTTREYEDYRRFILDIPVNELSSDNSFIKPIVKSEADSGFFSIMIESNKVQQYAGERLRKSEGKIPVRFIISYPDSNSILVQGNTSKFDKITSFYIIDENKYVFDIYKYDTDDNYYSNSVQLLNNEKLAKPIKKQTTELVNSSKNTRSQVTKSQEKGNLLNQSIKTASMILTGLIFIIIATYFIMKIYSGKSIFKNISKLSQSSPVPVKSRRKIQPEQKFEEENQIIRESIQQVRISKPPTNPIINESAINSMLFDKRERQIRKIMNSKKLNYNEAEMVFNLSHGSLVG